MGLTKGQNDLIFFYEATCIVVSSFLTGISTGLLTTLLIAGLFSQLAELPRNTVIPHKEILFMLVVITFSTFLAVRIPAAQMNNKQISSVLKGIDN